MMSIDELQLVRDANPVARSPEPPPIGLLRERHDSARRGRRAGMAIGWRRRGVTVTAAAVAAAVAAFAAFVIGAGSDPQATAAPVHSGGLLLGEHFAPFRAQAQGDDPDNPFAQRPGDPTDQASERRLATLAMDPRSARRLEVLGAMVWVAANDTLVCISARSALEPNGTRGACARPVQILEDGLYVGGRPSPAYVKARGLPAGTTEIAGLLPDGVSSVTFTLADGARRDVTVTDNGIAVTLPSAPQDVRFRDRSNIAHLHRL
jgi:hypothetical protein